MRRASSAYNRNSRLQRLFYDHFALPAERAFSERLLDAQAAPEHFVDRCFGMHFRCGAPLHNFCAEEIGEDGRTHLFAVITSIFSVPAALADIRCYVHEEYRGKYERSFAGDSEVRRPPNRELRYSCEFQRTNAFTKHIAEWPLLQLPEAFLEKYNSFVNIRWRHFQPEAAWVRRLFQCTAATLAMNGETARLKFADHRCAFQAQTVSSPSSHPTNTSASACFSASDWAQSTTSRWTATRCSRTLCSHPSEAHARAHAQKLRLFSSFANLNLFETFA